MDYDVINNSKEFISNHSGWFIAGGILTSLYLLEKINYLTKPVIEGKIIETNFTNKGDSRIKVHTEKQGDLYLILDTKKEPYIYVTLRSENNYKGMAQLLQSMLPNGTTIKAKVEERKGLERRVLSLLNLNA